MHRLQNQSAINRFRITALLICLKFLIPCVVFSLLGYGLLFDEKLFVLAAIGAMGLFFIVAIIQWIVATKARCPLCMTPVMADKACSKHRNARTLLGSYRFRVAVSTLLRRQFRCPYCGEPTEIQVRERRH